MRSALLDAVSYPAHTTVIFVLLKIYPFLAILPLVRSVLKRNEVPWRGLPLRRSGIRIQNLIRRGDKFS